jgi:hypothetical protein
MAAAAVGMLGWRRVVRRRRGMSVLMGCVILGWMRHLLRVLHLHLALLLLLPGPFLLRLLLHLTLLFHLLLVCTLLRLLLHFVLLFHLLLTGTLLCLDLCLMLLLHLILAGVRRRKLDWAHHGQASGSRRRRVRGRRVRRGFGLAWMDKA